MVPQDYHDRFNIFFVVWVVLAVASAAFFYGSNNATLKRKIFPFWISFAGGLFIVFTSYIQGHFSWFPILPVALIIYLNIKNTKFCTVCGKTQYNRNLTTPQKYCANCGSSLQQAD